MNPLKAVLTAVAALVVAAALAGCGSAPKSAAPVKQAAVAIGNPFAVLQAETDKYLQQDRPLYIEPEEVLAKAVTAGDQSLYLVDIRNDEHYAAAHIPGAIHIAYADVWREQKTAYLPRDKKIVVIDYSGHTASQVAAFWSMLGFDATAMKNGMAGWSRDREVVGGSPLACEALNYPVTTAVTAAAGHELPKIETKAVSLAELLAERSREATGTAPVIQPQDLLAKRGEYFLADIRRGEHYGAGHIEGAVNIPFRSLAMTENLRKLPADRTIVVVDYDGHAASQAARLLNQLGYKATVLKNGMSVWTADEKVIGAKSVACNVGEHPVAKLNAPLKPGPSTAAT
ncbi:rhodanese-like domain-containing protein [Anaeroselena agilis]|uniref:Rhodanese-like domain-containing protein n=1 Tax=Anaeroselena agilis TaxID=3063788 RepID=A0ABU3P7B2_9FIRM|nr:rhodanese-like domain-containing protein [Selenomonadales bacterium 4137-cl]